MGFKPPQPVQRAAAKGLELRRAHGRGGTAVGVARARDLSTGTEVSERTIARMVSYFARHAVDKDAEGSDASGRWGDDDNPSAGYVAWLLWGGDPGREWAEGILEDLDKDDDDTRDDAPRPDGWRLDEAPREWRTGLVDLRLDAGDTLRASERTLLRPPRRTPDGGWVYQGIVARGDEVKVYQTPAGERRELAPWSELRRREVVDALAGINLTVEHPGVVTPSSAPTLPMVGRVLWGQALEGPRLLIAEVYADAQLDRPGLSMGWHCAMDTRGGTTSRGEHYDAVQRGYEPNHLASCVAPRVAGAGVRVDSTDTQEADNMVKILINGVLYEVAPEVAAELNGRQTKLDTAEANVATITGERDALKVERDTLKGANAALQARVDAAPNDADINARVKARVALVERVKGHLPGFDVDNATDAQIRAAVVDKAGIKLDSNASADMVAGAFEGALAVLSRGSNTLRIIDGGDKGNRTDNGDDKPVGLDAINAKLAGR